LNEKEKPFGVEVIAALSLLYAVYLLIYSSRDAATLFQAGLGLLCAVGLWLFQPWGWWAAVLRSVVIIGLSVFAFVQAPAVGFLAQAAGALLPLIYLLLPGVRKAFGIRRSPSLAPTKSEKGQGRG
jgi:uncharacterized membrane protein (DUF2068 family)